MLAQKLQDDWSPWELLEYQGYYVKHIKSVYRQCRLSDGLYHIKISGLPGNRNSQGRCGLHASGEVEIRKEDHQLLSTALEGDCLSSDFVIVEITVMPGMEVVIKSVPDGTFL